MKIQENLTNYFVGIYLKNLFKNIKNYMSKYLFIIGIMIIAITLNIVH